MPIRNRLPRQDASIYKWLVVAMLWCVCLLNYADRQAIFAVFPAIRTNLRLTDWQLALAGSAFMWMYAAFGPVAGWLGDRLPRKTLILSALFFWSLVTGATAWADNFTALVILRGLGGLGEAFYFPAAMSMLSDYHDSQTRSRAMSLHQSSVYAGSIAGATVTGYAADSFGWQAGFLVFGVAGVLLAAFLVLFLREPQRLEVASGSSATPLWSSLREVLGTRRVRLLLGVFMCANFVAVVFLTWMPAYLGSVFHLSLGAAGLHSTAGLQIASVLGVLVGGWLADRWARRNAEGRIRTQAMGLLCGVPFLVLIGQTLSLPLLVTGLIGFGFCKGIYDANIFAALHDVIPAEQRAAAVGLMNSFAWLAGGVAPVTIAWGAQRFGFGACLTGTAGIYLMAGLALAATGASRSNGNVPPMRLAAGVLRI